MVLPQNTESDKHRLCNLYAVVGLIPTMGNSSLFQSHRLNCATHRSLERFPLFPFIDKNKLSQVRFLDQALERDRPAGDDGSSPREEASPQAKGAVGDDCVVARGEDGQVCT